MTLSLFCLGDFQAVPEMLPFSFPGGAVSVRENRKGQSGQQIDNVMMAQIDGRQNQSNPKRKKEPEELSNEPESISKSQGGNRNVQGRESGT
jgi:hypothetical protein